MLSRRTFVASTTAAISSLPWTTARAAVYPERTVTVVIPWPAGGGTDVIGRLIAERLQKRLGQAVVVENKPGASGNIGAVTVVRSQPDGYTVMLASMTIALTPHMTATSPFDPITDLEPITLVASSPHMLVVHPSVPAQSVQELIALAKQKPGEFTYASAGVGTPFHIAAELFKQLVGADIRHVSYRGGAPAITDVIGGHVNMAFANLVAALPYIKGGQLRALGVTSAKRSSAAPDIPTIAEAGVPGYALDAWFGYLAPAKTPRPILDKLHAEIGDVLRTSEIQERLALDGAEPIIGGPDQFRTYLAAETAKWKRLIEAANIKAN